jgi:hypothetical protein
MRVPFGFPDGLAAFLFGGNPRIKKRQDSAPSRELRIGLLGWGFKPLRLVKNLNRNEKAPNWETFSLCFEDYRLNKRETRFERATSTLARLRSTTELHPQTHGFLTTPITIAAFW